MKASVRSLYFVWCLVSGFAVAYYMDFLFIIPLIALNAALPRLLRD